MTKQKSYQLDEPLQLHRPKTRRDFISQGLMSGTAAVAAPTIFSLFANPQQAQAALSPDLETLKASCNINSLGSGKIPFICFDLAGGANISGSNVLVGGSGGQLDLLRDEGYSKLGIPNQMVPGRATEATPTATSNGDYTDSTLGLNFHADSSMLRGILTSAIDARGFVDGAIIPARSDNDTGNNPHNPMYGIYQTVAGGNQGSLLSLIGSRTSVSGGNSMAPAHLINSSARPTKIDRPSDVTGLVDTGKLVRRETSPGNYTGLLEQSDAVAVLEAIQRISDHKLGAVNTNITSDAVMKELIRCGYVKTADLADRFGNPNDLNPSTDDRIVGGNGFTPIFSEADLNDNEFRKTASIMKLVVNGYASAGTVAMGGYDYHTGERATGERRDFRAGRCIGACLEYAARMNRPLMIYVFSDGSLASNGRIDDSMDGRGKGEWTGDNSSTAASFFLVHNPSGQPQLMNNDPARRQIGFMRPDASVETSATPAANNVNLLVNTVLLNYMALHGEQNQFAGRFPGHGLGNSTLMDSLTAFQPITT